MADEARVQCYLQIDKDNLSYASRPSSFLVDVTTAKGPTPGVVTVTTAGVDIDLTELTTPALCRIMNLDDTNFVEIGIWDTTEFFPLIEILAGESYVIRLSRYAQGPGTAGTYAIRARANTATCNIIVEAFEA